MAITTSKASVNVNKLLESKVASDLMDDIRELCFDNLSATWSTIKISGSTGCVKGTDADIVFKSVISCLRDKRKCKITKFKTKTCSDRNIIFKITPSYPHTYTFTREGGILTVTSKRGEKKIKEDKIHSLSDLL
jgi:hypothetical protein